MAKSDQPPFKKGRKAQPAEKAAENREDRLGEALRANLRRRKAAAKTRQKD